MVDDARRLELARAAPATVRDYEPAKVYDLWQNLLNVGKTEDIASQ